MYDNTPKRKEKLESKSDDIFFDPGQAVRMRFKTKFNWLPNTIFVVILLITSSLP